MKTRSVPALLGCLLFFFSSGSYSAQTQQEINAKGCLGYKKADAVMNDLYRQVLNEYRDDKNFIAKFRDAQRAWLMFRDTYITSIYPGDPSEYGSINTMCQCEIREELTITRVAQLRKWIDGVLEGDTCGGSIRLRQEPARNGRRSHSTRR